jgi:RNA polymerase sigma-70 factor (ECF subfamily)
MLRIQSWNALPHGRHSPEMGAMDEGTSALDDVLIRRFAKGDEAAFVALHRRYSPAVYGLLCRLLGPHRPDATDLLQETWIRAAARLSSFRGDSQFRTWLMGVAVNVYREWRRRQDRYEPVELTDLGADGPDERDGDIRRVLTGMPDAFREILVLHDVEGYTHDEIARLIGIEPGTSKSRLSRARQLFRQRWLPPGGAWRRTS